MVSEFFMGPLCVYWCPCAAGRTKKERRMFVFHRCSHICKLLEVSTGPPVVISNLSVCENSLVYSELSKWLVITVGRTLTTITALQKLHLLL